MKIKDLMLPIAAFGVGAFIASRSKTKAAVGMLMEYTKNGVPYTWELSGPDGAAFILYPKPEHTAEDIKRAKAYIRANQDATSIHVADEYDLDEKYKSEIFAQRETKPLKWYQIEQDDDILRRERRKGTTPAEFVHKFVLPFVEETAAKYRARYGDKMTL